MADQPRRLEYMRLDDLTPDPANAKAHAHDLIGDSVSRHGVIDLPVIDERTGYLIAGHGRREVLCRRRDAGEPPPEGVHVAEDGSWLVPVVRGWASRDDGEATAARIGLNQGTIAGGWVPDLLAEQLRELQQQQDGLIGVGFTSADIDLLLSEVADPNLLATDPQREWEDMTEFESDDLVSKIRLVVHFPAEEDRQEFLKLIGNPPVRQNSLWWPRPDDADVGERWDQHYVAVDEVAAGAEGQ